MPTPRPEDDMLHMQHAHVAALLARQQEAARLKAQRDSAATARRAAAPLAPEAAAASSARRVPAVQRPRPA